MVLALFNYEKKYLIKIFISVSVCVYWKIDEKVRLNFRSISTFNNRSAWCSLSARYSAGSLCSLRLPRQNSMSQEVILRVLSNMEETYKYRQVIIQKPLCPYEYTIKWISTHNGLSAKEEVTSTTLSLSYPTAVSRLLTKSS